MLFKHNELSQWLPADITVVYTLAEGSSERSISMMTGPRISLQASYAACPALLRCMRPCKKSTS